MNSGFSDFVHPAHFSVFVQAARTFNCHILVRKTGRASINWIGRRGYTGKRADLKAKTANRSVGRWQTEGLVCSPRLLPQAFTPQRLASALKEWSKSEHLITVPKDRAGFPDDRQPLGCRTPYLVQTNPNHRHYGCVALVDMGLLVPRYVHGDYDLYAVIPAGQAFDPDGVKARQSTLGSTMAPARMGLQEKLGLSVPNLEGPLSFRVATFLNNRIAGTSPDLLGALMVNHGEQINLGKPGQTYEPVLAVMPERRNGQWSLVLATRTDHEAFYRHA